MTNEVFGRPIKGDITRSNKTSYAQWDPSVFIENLDELFSDERIEAIRWEQYTPYFNDGDACEFTIHDDIRVKVAGVDVDGDYDDGFIEKYSLYRYANARMNDFTIIEVTELNGVNVEGLNKHIEEYNPVSVHHEEWLRETFGDHAVVTATRDGFSVDYYEHD